MGSCWGTFLFRAFVFRDFLGDDHLGTLYDCGKGGCAEFDIGYTGPGVVVNVLLGVITEVKGPTVRLVVDLGGDLRQGPLIVWRAVCLDQLIGGVLDVLLVAGAFLCHGGSLPISCRG